MRNTRYSIHLDSNGESLKIIFHVTKKIIIYEILVMNIIICAKLTYLTHNNTHTPKRQAVVKSTYFKILQCTFHSFFLLLDFVFYYELTS